MKQVTVIGLGSMGSRIASRLLSAGFGVVVHNRTRARAESLLADGARWAASPRSAAEGSDAVLSLVRDDPASAAIWDGDDGVLSGMHPRAIGLESSTVTPGRAKQLAQAAAARGLQLLDAPVVGSRPQAEAGTLIFLVGGESKTVARCRSIFDCLGSAAHHIGPSGAGANFKLMVNALFGIQVAAISELLKLGQSAGIAQGDAARVLKTLPVTSPAAGAAAAGIAAAQFAPNFPLELVSKDFEYVESTAKTLGAKIPLSSASRSLFEQACHAGYQGDNITAVAKLY